MAHPGRSRSLLPALPLVLLLAACGGKTSDTVVVVDGDGGTDTNPPELVTGFHSYMLTVDDASIDWSSGGGGGSWGKAVSKGSRARLDLDNGYGSATKQAGAAIVTPFGEPVGLGGFAASPLVLSADPSGAGGQLSFSGKSDGYSVSETYDKFTFVLDARGVPVSGTATGRANSFAGDVGAMGTVTMHFSLVSDGEAPTFGASASAGFGAVSLPWDDRVVSVSEPYEERLTPESVLGKGLIGTTTKTSLLWGAPPRDRDRGFVFHLNSWIDPLGIAVTAPTVHDLAGNASASTVLSFVKNAVVVNELESSTLEVLSAGSSLATVWGPTKAIDGCPDGKPCYALGPVTASYCGRGSYAGLAAALVGNGGVFFTVRVVAKPRLGGGGGLPGNLVYLQTANPGAKPLSDGGVSVKMPDKPGADGSWDTGWVTVTMATPDPSASETGVAVSVGGTGVPSGDVDCGFAPPPIDVMVYVQRVAVGGVK